MISRVSRLPLPLHRLVAFAAASLVVAGGADPAAATCGDGVVDVGEECDGTACCGASCTFAVEGTPCSDGNACNGEEICVAGGVCLGGGLFTCDDRNPCTLDRCDPATGCVNEATPRVGCFEGWAKKLLGVDEKSGGDEKLTLKLAKGPGLTAEDFGEPADRGATSYAVCIFDDEDDLAGTLVVDRGGESCGRRDCWRRLGDDGFRYRDPARAADGVQKAKLVAGPAGRSRIELRARNVAARGSGHLPTGIAAALAGAEGATVQIVGSDTPACFSATFDRVVRNGAAEFRAK